MASDSGCVCCEQFCSKCALPRSWHYSVLVTWVASPKSPRMAYRAGMKKRTIRVDAIIPNTMLVAKGMSTWACRLFSSNRGVSPAIVVNIKYAFELPEPLLHFNRGVFKHRKIAAFDSDFDRLPGRAKRRLGKF